MSKEVPWNKIIVDEFIRLACLSDEEKDVLITRVVKHWTRTKQHMELHMSMSKLDRIISSLKEKYDGVQPYSDILPKRKYSKEEKYLDEN